MFKYFRKQEGFTLVELMVVVLIIGILIAIAIPIFNSASMNAKRKACAANIRTINGSVQQWAAEASNAATPTVAQLATQGFLKEVPTCPITPSAAYALGADGMVVDTAHQH